MLVCFRHEELAGDATRGREPGVELRIWLKQGKEKRLLARILKFLEKARKRRQKSA
jgi:hypothetical protein